MSQQDGPQYEEARGDVLFAVFLYPITVLLCAVLFAAAGILLGYSREPTYTASSELLVGNLSVSDPGAVPGAVSASRSLAEVYARLVDANEVEEEVDAATAGLNPATVTATPIVETPLVRVTAQSGSEDAAITYANTSADALSNYVNGLKSPGSDVTSVSKRFREAALLYEQKLEVVNRLKDRFKPFLNAEEINRLNEAESELQTAKLKRTALGAIFQRGQNIRVSQPSLTVFRSAESAANDRSSTVQITAGVGLLAGLLIGVAVAMIRTSRRAKRQAT